MVNMLNSIIIEGKLEKIESNSGIVVFTICTERCNKINGQKKTEISFFECKCVGKMAQFIEEEFVKGELVRIVGRLQQSSSKVFIIPEHIEFKGVNHA